ncbi:MAG TPA: alpha/beta hydrolase family protein [Amycolatopsis sp.]|jgi:pimeloyl-ACP methyl ester carboxylesterase|nr:alpha/beta hydrolase family protein [Amycolatopsis sp.]
MTRTCIDLAVDGRRVAGIATGPGVAEAPLLVALHGGGYNSRYFDVAGHSLLDLGEATGFPIFALDRPGHGGSDPLAEGEVTYARGAEVLDAAIEQLWADHGAGRPGVVILSHSIGSAIAVHIAARQPHWPLLGMSLHGVNDVSPEPVVSLWRGSPSGQPITLTPEQRRAFLYGPDESVDPAAIECAQASSEPLLLEEALEVVGEWTAAVPRLGSEVTVPVQYTLAEHDRLWVVDADRVAAFAGHFTTAAWVDARLLPGSGHNIDHHRLSRALHLRQLAFAWECATRI